MNLCNITLLKLFLISTYLIHHVSAGTVIRDDMGLTLENAHKDLLGTASKVVITKDSTLIVTDGNTRAAVMRRVTQIQKLVEVCHLRLHLINSQILRMDLIVVSELIDTHEYLINLQIYSLSDVPEIGQHTKLAECSGVKWLFS